LVLNVFPQEVNILAEYVDKGLKKFGISISKPILAAVCIIGGVLVLLLPSLLVWTVGLLLVVQGALILTDYFEEEKRRTATNLKGVYCRNCGAGNTGESVFCKACGKELSQAPQAVVLPAQEMVQ